MNLGIGLTDGSEFSRYGNSSVNLGMSGSGFGYEVGSFRLM